MALLEWFANNYKNFGATLEIITDKSQEGAQFVKGFGGIGGEIPSHAMNSAVTLFGGHPQLLFPLNTFVERCFSVSGILRYQVDFQSLEAFDDLGDDFDLDDY